MSQKLNKKEIAVILTYFILYSPAFVIGFIAYHFEVMYKDGKEKAMLFNRWLFKKIED